MYFLVPVKYMIFATIVSSKASTHLALETSFLWRSKKFSYLLFGMYLGFNADRKITFFAATSM